MNYVELSLLHERIQLDGVFYRAKRNAQSYKDVQTLLRAAPQADAHWIVSQAHRLRSYTRGVNLNRLRLLIERITGEPLCW